MTEAFGLYTHIRANRIRSGVLLLGFVVLIHALLFSLILAANALGGGSFEQILNASTRQFSRSWPLAGLGALAWLAIAFFTHQRLISAATGAKAVTRREMPELYNELEALCISRGMTMPTLQIIETPALNAYAAGIKDGDYVVAVTRGLIETLDPQEVRAVLAHELTHIRNRDTQLMVVAVIFAGIFAFFGDMIIRGWDFPYGLSPSSKRQRESNTGWGSSTSGNDSRSSSGRDKGGGALLALAIAVVIILISWGLSTLIRFALSRSREYMADAGSVELTKNPDAMISALQKISKQATFDVPSRMEAFFIENPVSQRITGLLATHPAIEDRIAALEKYAGGKRAEPRTA
ncbi:MAG: M48 family metallopeptidase [Hyphomicrobiaceae bacterium]|nr:M48 family metallopeptidase [Hyphomicrobiaceae bacterium]